MRDARAGYHQSLAVLEHVKKYKPTMLTKTSIMLGLGETDKEVMTTMKGLSTLICCFSEEVEF